MTLAMVSLGSESTTAASMTVSFEPQPRVLSSDQPFPLFSIRRFAELATERAAVEQMEDGRFFAESDQLPGVWGDGDTAEDALAEFSDAVAEWVSVKIDQRHGDIPVLGSLDLNVL